MGICSHNSNKPYEEEEHPLTKPPIPIRPEIYDQYTDKEFILLEELFKDLASRSPNDTVSKSTFLEYFALPGILGDRLFAVFDIKHNEVIDFVEFLTGLARYNQGSLQDKITMLFEIYDMNGEKQVNKEELSLILYTVITPTTQIFHNRNRNNENKNDSKDADINENVDPKDEDINENVDPTVSKVNRQMVDKMIKNAFAHFDTNHDGLLSKEQFTNWVKQNPSTLRLLENALSKHKLSSSNSIGKNGILYNKYNKRFVSRYYVLKDNFLYVFLNEIDEETDEKTVTNVIFIKGWYINKKNDTYLKKGYYGIELTSPTTSDKSNNSILYCKTEENRAEWIERLQIEASTLSIKQHYNIDNKLLGKSHFSTVYEGYNKQTNKLYAIKIVEKSIIDEEYKLFLRNEIAIMQLVNHPSLIKCWDVFVDVNRIYMVMTIAPYGNFFHRWKKTKRYKEDIARKIIWKLLDAINYLHKLGIVHRDLKPENILCLDEHDDTQIVLSDFGLSKFATPKQVMTMPCGTLCYVAPEVLSKKPYGYKVDLWSLGCIMHLLLRGVLPFDGYTPQEIREKTLHKQLNLSSPKWDIVTDNAKDLITKLLIKDPNERISIDGALNHIWFFQNNDEDSLEIHDAIAPTIQFLANSLESHQK